MPTNTPKLDLLSAEPSAWSDGMPGKVSQYEHLRIDIEEYSRAHDGFGLS